MDNSTKKVIIIGVIVVILSGIVMYGMPDLLSPRSETTEDSMVSVQTQPQTTEKVGIEEITEGTGEAVKSGDTVIIHYRGTLEDGTQFDSSYDRGEPYETQIGTGVVIKGWDQGVPGMKVGGKRKLTIPPSLAYGEQGMPPAIPPDATLLFEVELLEIK